MSVAEQWKSLGSELPADWGNVELSLVLPDRDAANAAAGALGPAGPFRTQPTELRFRAARDGTSVGPDNLERLLRRIPEGKLSVAAVQRTRPPAAMDEGPSLAESWREALATLPSDWSDLYGEMVLASTDFVERAAVLCIQMNPRRDGERPAFVFRCARKAGYGVAPEMARRCFERCDEAGIRGSVSVLRVLSDTRLVQTQGPTWLLDGKHV